MNKYTNIDLSDIPEVTGKRKARRNPFYERIMREGISITEHYTPEDIEQIKRGNLSRRIDIELLDNEELAALEEYNRKHNIKA